jgi:hypothetical protein
VCRDCLTVQLCFAVVLRGLYPRANSIHSYDLEIPNTQAKAPAPPRWINSLQSKVGQAFSLPNFCHGLLAPLGCPAEACEQRYQRSRIKSLTAKAKDLGYQLIPITA